MPGYANWRTLYKDEHFQLREEGYPVEGHPAPNPDQEDPMPEAEWERAYWDLWKVREKGIRPDFPYTEPEDYEGTIRAAGDLPPLVPLDMDEYAERIKGAWYGRCAAVLLGKPLEMGFDRLKVKAYLESVDAYPLNDWVPARSEKLDITLRQDCIPSTKGNVRYVQSDDDIHYTVMSVLLAEQKGLDFTRLDVGMNLLENVPYKWLWVADNQAYYHLVNMTDDRSKEEQVDEIALKINPWRECMDGYLKADFWGYITPGAPREGAMYACRQSALSLVKNGIYGGMFVAGCLSAALSQNPAVDTILQGGLSVIPKNSRLAHAVKEVVKWYSEEPAWIPVCDRIYAKYGHWYFAATINNLSFVTLALLEGQLDFTKTITTAVMCGTDTDCNSATAGSIVGAAIGYDEIEPRWVTPLNDTVKTVVAGFGEGKISELVRRTIDFYTRHT